MLKPKTTEEGLAVPGVPAPPAASAAGEETLARGKSGEGAHSALEVLKRRLQARGLLQSPPSEPEPEAP